MKTVAGFHTTITFAFAAAAAAQTEASFTVIGAGCAGANGTPAHTAAAYPYLGNSLYTLYLDRAVAGAPVVLTIGLGLFASPLPLPGAPQCLLYHNPTVQVPAIARADGRDIASLSIPNNAAFQGLELTSQYVALDTGANALGLTVSNAGRSVLGSPPPITIQSVVAGPGVGEITVTGTGLGSRPHFCAMNVAPAGSVFFVGQTIRSAGASQVLVLRSAAGPSVTFTSGTLSLFRGAGGAPRLTGNARFLAPQATLAWLGQAPAVNMAVRAGIGSSTSPQCPSGFTSALGLVQPYNGGTQGPCVLVCPPVGCRDAAGNFKQNSTVTFHFHWDWSGCTTAGVANHYDVWMKDVIINASGMSELDLMDEVNRLVRNAFFLEKNQSISTTTILQGGRTCSVFCPPAGASCGTLTINPVSTLVVCCP